MTENCGTYKGWRHHHNAKEPPCEPCRAARYYYMHPGGIYKRKYRDTTEIDAITATAINMVTDVREQNPVDVLRAAATLCRHNPILAGQTMMALAIWVGDATTGELEQRTLQTMRDVTV